MKNVVFFKPKSWWKDDIYYLLKSSCFKLSDDRKYGLFWSQGVDRKDHIYWLQKSSCFELFGGRKYGLFLSQEVDGKDDIYWLPKSSCFEIFGDGKYDLFFSQKVYGKMIFTWSFLAFPDIPGPGKYGFWCSVHIFPLINLSAYVSI